MTTHYNRWSPDITRYLIPPYQKLGGCKFAIATRTPTKNDKLNGLYLPRLKLIRAVRSGGYSTRLYMELSAPKVVFNNNFDELGDGDFDNLCKQLAKTLRRLGIVVDKETIKNASVNAIHYSKNVILTDGRLARTLVQELAKTNVSTRRQTKRKTYGDDGEAMYFHTNKWAFVAYDKLAELRHSRLSSKGLFEKDYYCQLSLFDEYTPSTPFEVLRLEARYTDRRTIKSNLKKAGIRYSNELTFAELYSENTAKTILLHELNDLELATPDIMLSNSDTGRLVAELVVNNPNAQTSTLVEAIGLRTMLDQYGSRGARSMLNANSGQWSRLIAKNKKLNFTRQGHDGIATIRQSVELFRRVKLTNYKEK